MQMSEDLFIEVMGKMPSAIGAGGEG